MVKSTKSFKHARFAQTVGILVHNLEAEAPHWPNELAPRGGSALFVQIKPPEPAAEYLE